MRCTLLCLLVLYLPAVRAQDVPPAPAPEPTGQLVALNQTVLALLQRQADTQGGLERLAKLRTVDFRLDLAKHVDGEFVVEPAMHVTLERGAPPLRARIQDQLEGRTLVKLAEAETLRLFVDGAATTLPDLLNGARAELRILRETVEMLVGLGLGNMGVRDEGQRKRDGKIYYCLSVRLNEFGTGRALLAFLDPATGLVHRVDTFDPTTGMRVQTARFSGYPEGEGPKLPGEVTFFDREDKPLSRWRFEAVRFDPELPATHFDAP